MDERTIFCQLPECGYVLGGLTPPGNAGNDRPASVRGVLKSTQEEPVAKNLLGVDADGEQVVDKHLWPAHPQPLIHEENTIFMQPAI